MMSKVFRTCLRAAVAAALAALVLYFVPLPGVADALRSVRVGWLCPALLIVFAWRVLASHRLAIFARAQGLTSGAWRLLGVSLISSFFATFTPGFAATGVVRWYLLSESGRHKTAALTALLSDRLFDLVAMLGLGLLGLVLSQLATPAWLRGGAAVLFVLALAGWLLLRSRFSSSWIEAAATRLPARLRGPADQLAQLLRRIRGLSSGQRLLVGLLSLLSNLVNALGMSCLFLALSLPLGYADALWLRCAVFVAGVLPITILGLGVREALLTALLAPVGVPRRPP